MPASKPTVRQRPAHCLKPVRPPAWPTSRRHLARACCAPKLLINSSPGLLHWYLHSGLPFSYASPFSFYFSSLYFTAQYTALSTPPTTNGDLAARPRWPLFSPHRRRFSSPLSTILIQLLHTSLRCLQNVYKPFKTRIEQAIFTKSHLPPLPFRVTSRLLPAFLVSLSSRPPTLNALPCHRANSCSESISLSRLLPSNFERFTEPPC
ncbi:hypothetical protein BC827DRAFT_197764 [Russula dissimulans]|nr:hypothetical protein BC827DRAFT_197764 [Russula dissimulans]